MVTMLETRLAPQVLNHLKITPEISSNLPS